MLTLTHKERVSPNSSLYRFSFPDPTAVSGLTVASCLVTQAPAGKEGAAVVRPYTPVSFPRRRKATWTWS